MSQDKTKIEPLPQKWLIALGVASVLFLLAESTYTKHHTHVHYEEWYGFFGIAAIATMAVLALISMLVRPLLRRDRSHYDG